MELCCEAPCRANAHGGEYAANEKSNEGARPEDCQQAGSYEVTPYHAGETLAISGRACRETFLANRETFPSRAP